MKKLALGALFAGLAACGGGSGKSDIVITDSSTMDGGGICNPLTQTGCNAGEKCNWIYDQLMPTIVGHIGCEPAGTVAIGGDCGDRAVGPDMCVGGAECVSGECKAICDNNGGAPMCDDDHACVQYQNLFIDGTSTVAGVCDPSCDPLTQDLKVGTNKTACGSPDPMKPVKGCYGYDEYSCSGVAPTVAIDDALALTDRATPAGDYLNSCAPGFMPLLITETGSMTGVCNGLCAALETDNTPAHVNNEKGDPTVLAKSPTAPAPVAGAGTCEATKRGNGEPETCRFLWIYNVDDAGMLAITDYTDTLGVCFARGHYKWDSNGNGMADSMDANVPECKGLPPRSATTTMPGDDAADFFCQTVDHSMFQAIDHPHKKGDKIYVGETGVDVASTRLYDPRKEGAVPMRRHAFAN